MEREGTLAFPFWLDWDGEAGGAGGFEIARDRVRGIADFCFDRRGDLPAFEFRFRIDEVT